mmetsp:Transcript_16406/g.26351  ORF Transcript_16406/g.26351 Transcript_16406/m.26351 type:complete len:260 (+) Transcript_16406:387-1166(+)
MAQSSRETTSRVHGPMSAVQQLHLQLRVGGLDAGHVRLRDFQELAHVRKTGLLKVRNAVCEATNVRLEDGIAEPDLAKLGLRRVFDDVVEVLGHRLCCHFGLAFVCCLQPHEDLFELRTHFLDPVLLFLLLLLFLRIFGSEATLCPILPQLLLHASNRLGVVLLLLLAQPLFIAQRCLPLLLKGFLRLFAKLNPLLLTFVVPHPLRFCLAVPLRLQFGLQLLGLLLFLFLSERSLRGNSLRGLLWGPRLINVYIFAVLA